ncbi:MAG TPA: ureidoglycolate lyase, partial [Afifellaceae bacterium]|nr:ureidoglycolate lyase [Afifellaceae bacterium]
MLAREITICPLSKAAFAGFGDVIETKDARQRLVNDGTATRFDDLAAIDVADQGGRPLISIFRGQPFAFPVEIAMMERHPLGSQAFFPLHDRPFLVV